MPRATANEADFNTAQEPLIEAGGGIFSMSEAAIERNIAALSQIGIKAPRSIFDTSLLDEV